MPTDIKITTSTLAGRQCASSGSRWEPIMGYSRAVRAGNMIAVTGSVGINADGTYSKSLGDQTRRSLQIIQAAIEALGGRIDQVIRTRMYVTDVYQMGGSGAGPWRNFRRHPPGHDDCRSGAVDR